jgi:hypothetical protein
VRTLSHVFFLDPSPVRRVPIPNRYTAKAKLCFCKNNKRSIINMLPAHQLEGELAIPVPRYRHTHATNNGACSRDAPGSTNSLPLHPRIGAAERRPNRCSGHQHGSDGGLANASQAWRARARTTRHARTCPPCPCSHHAARQHLQQCNRGVDGPGAGDDGPPAAGGGGTCCHRTSCRAS